MKQSFISVVAPVFNEAQTIREFFTRVTQTLKNFSFELVLVDDGSHDLSWQIIQELAKSNKSIRAIRLARNFGHQAALTAGLEHAKGDAVIIIDSDLQDPPEIILEMIEKWKEGFDVVYGVRKERKGESLFKKTTASLFYHFFRSTSQINAPLEAGDFRLLSRNVVNALKQLPERVRFLRGLTSWVGFKQTGVYYTRDPRFSGETKFSIVRMLRFALDGITSFSALPLQMAIYVGFFTTLISILVIFYSLYIKLFSHDVVPGWTSLLSVVVFLGGVQLLMIGVIGEYISRIYQEVKQRPVYIVEQTIEANG